METCLLSYYLHNKEVKSSCDFNFQINNYTIGIYEVIRIIDGKPLFLEEHIERFFISCKIQKIKPDINQLQISKRIKTLIELNNQSLGNIKWALVQADSGKQDFLIWASPFFYPSADLINTGVNCLFYKALRTNPNSKTFKSELQTNIRNYISENEIFDAVLIDENNKIYEGSRTNLFFMKGNTIFTAKDKDVLLGISREKLIKSCKFLGISIIKRDIFTTEMGNFDLAFLSGTSINLLPIKKLGTRKYNTNNEVFIQLLKNYKLQLKTYIENFDWN